MASLVDKILRHYLRCVMVFIIYLQPSVGTAGCDVMMSVSAPRPLTPLLLAGNCPLLLCCCWCFVPRSPATTTQQHHRSKADTGHLTTGPRNGWRRMLVSWTVRISAVKRSIGSTNDQALIA